MTYDPYLAPADDSWFHFTTGSLAADMGIIFGGESLFKGIAGQRSALMGPGQANWVKGLPGARYLDKLFPYAMVEALEHGGGRRIPAFGGQPMHYKNAPGVSAATRKIMTAAVNKGVISNPYLLLNSKDAGVRALASKIGGKRLLASAAITFGLRGIWTAFNVQLGVELGGSLGNAVANYEATPHLQLETAGYFADTRSSYTQRQRAIQAIHNSQMTTRAALGNEASFMHQG